MANSTTNSLSRTYNGQETTDIFIKPALGGEDFLSKYHIMPNVVHKRQLNFRPKASKITHPRTGCGFSTTGTIALTDKELEVFAMKIHLEQCEDALADTIFEEEWYKKGTDITDLTGTKIEELVAQYNIEGVKRDITRKAWFADTSSASNDWKDYNGWISKLVTSSASLGGTGVYDISTVETASALDADAADTAFKNIYANRHSSMNEVPRTQMRIYASQGLVDNYEDTLINQNNSWGAEQRVSGTSQLAYKGIPIVAMPEWDVDLADADNPIASTLNTTSNNMAILTVPDNLVMGLDAVSAVQGTDAKIWFSMDNQTLRSVLNFKHGVEFLFEEWFTVAW